MKHEIIKTDNYLLVVKDCYEAISYEIPPIQYVIAHLPLNNADILESIDLLPPLEQEDDVEGLALTIFPRHENWTLNSDNADKRPIWIDGYNKAKENLHKILSDFYFYATDGEVCNHEIINEFIKSLSQPKMPIGFECQTFDTGDDKLDGTHVLGIRTTTNSQGQTVWVGKYIYA